MTSKERTKLKPGDRERLHRGLIEELHTLEDKEILTKLMDRASSDRLLPALKK